MALEERVELDVEEALRSVDSIEAALTGAAQSFKVAIAEALDLLSAVTVGEVDAGSVTTGIDAAVEAANLEPAIEAEASGVTTAIDAAVDDADATVTPEAEGGGLTSAIEEAVAGADATVTPEAVTEQITSQIEQAVGDADVAFEVEADTSAASAEVEALGQSADETAESTSNLSSSLDGLGGVSQLAAGEVGGIAATLGAVNEEASLATGAALSVAGALGVLFDQALDSETAQDRFNRALGETAEQVGNVHVEGLSTDLEGLAERAGSSDEAMKLAAARIADLGRSAGASDESIASTSENILLLATRATVLNPTLGDAGDVADRLTGALARGGRTTAAYGIALTAAEIEARALADTGKATAAELTVYERAAAGAAIVTGRLGTSLRTDIVEGSQGTQIQLRALREEFGNTLETFGEPLLDDVLAGIRTGQPLILGLAETFGELGEAAIPLAVEALEAFAPTMGLTTDLLTLLLRVLQPVIALIDAIPDPMLQAAAAVALFNRVLPIAGSGVTNLITKIGAGGLTSALTGLASPMGVVTITAGLLATAWSKHAEEQAASNARVREGAEAFRDEAASIADALAAITEKRIPENQIDDINRMGLSFRDLGDLARQGASGFERFLDESVRSGEITASVGAALRANGGDLRDLKLNYEALGVSASDMNDSNIGVVETFQSLQEEAQRSAKATLEQLVATDSLTAAQERTANAALNSKDRHVDYVGVLSEVRPASEDAAEGTDELGGSLEEERAAAEAAEAALESLLDAQLGYIDSNIAADNATRSFNESLADAKEKADNYAAAVRDAGVNSIEAKEAQGALDESVRGVRDAAIDSAKAQVRLAEDQAAASGGTIEASEKFAIYRQSLVEAAAQASGPTREAILGVIATLDALPSSTPIDITANTAQARREIAELNAALERLGIGASLNIALARAGGLMAGGSMNDGWTWVGEDGPELAHKSGSEVQVFSAQRSREMVGATAGGGGSTFHIYPQTDDIEEVAFAIDARLGGKRR